MSVKDYCLDAHLRERITQEESLLSKRETAHLREKRRLLEVLGYANWKRHEEKKRRKCSKGGGKKGERGAWTVSLWKIYGKS